MAAKSELWVRMSMKLTGILAVYDGVVRVSVWCLSILFTPVVAAAQNAAPDSLPPDREAETPDPGFARLANPAFPSPDVRAVPIDRGPKVERADVAPYFGEGVLAEAKAAYDAGRFTLAREKLDAAPDSVPARFLRAMSAYRQSDNAFAGKEFENLAEVYTALRDRCLVYAGWAYEAAKDYESAKRVFSAVDPRSRLLPDAKLGLSRALRNTKDLKGAVAALDGLVDKPAPPWGRDVGAEALLALADLQALTGAMVGKERAEKKSLWALWSKHPLTPQASKAEARLGALTDAANDVLVTRAEVLIDAHRNANGLALLEPVLPNLKLPDPLACRAHFAAGKGYRKQRQHVKAQAELLPVTKKCADADIRARALYTLGFSQTIVAPAQAPETYTTLAREYPEHSFADDGLFFAADSYLRNGQVDVAVDRLIELVDRYPTADFAAEALFKLFWVARSQSQWAEADDYLNEIERRWASVDDTGEVERAGYWRARVAEAQDQKDAALTLYETVARDHPASYYGLISREKLEALAPERAEAVRSATAAAPSQDPFPLYAGPVADDPQFHSAVELLRLGFGELVPMEVLSVDRTNLPADSLRLLVHVLALSGEARAAHGMTRLWLRRDLSGRLTSESRSVWEIAYPQVFRDLVVSASESADSLDPDLLQALMREESALDPKALSWAGALGLCQLMPATAAEVAAQLKLPRPTTAALLEPELNIQLGAKYLSGLVTRMKGTKQFALASYNAGEGAVGRWRRENGDGDVAAWVEGIPLQETRNYVKRVLRSYATYKLLYVPGEVAKTIAPLPPPTPKNKPKPTSKPKTG